MGPVRVRVMFCLLALATTVAGIAFARGQDDPAGVAAAPLRLGIVADTIGWGRHVGQRQTLARAAGAGWLREELQWANVVPRRGERRWGPIDRVFTAAAHRGLHILPLLNEAPPWARGRDHALPTDSRAYAAYVRDVVARYGPGGRFWRSHPHLDAALAPVWFELFNEPYFARPSHSAITAARYAALAQAGITAGRRANPRARFLIAADPATAGEPNLDRAWLAALAAAQPGLLTAADGVAAHPYAQDGAASLRSLDRLRAALSAQGSSLPIWVTEVGWSTCAHSAGCVTERTQAADLARFLNGVRKGHRAAAVFVYHLGSWRVGSGDQLFGDYGLLRADRTRKPSWRVYHRFADGLRRAAAS
jgi:hypothetical protein